MSTEDGKRLAASIAEQLRAKDERIAELEKALEKLMDATYPNEWGVRSSTQEVLAKGNAR